MKKISWKKIIIPTICGLTLLCGGGVFANQHHTINKENYSIVYAEDQIVTISNKKLDTAIRNLLGKAPTDKLYSTDFINNDFYKATTVTDPETSISQTTAKLYNLNLANTGITDITELCQFEFPETLHGINLSGNGITNSDLVNISSFLTYNTESPTITYNEKELTIRSNFSLLINKVNLNFNNIDLSSCTSYLSNDKLLFGIQGISNLDNSGLASTEELSNAKYYIRESDSQYLSYNFFYEFSTEVGGRIVRNNGTVTPLVCDNNCGHYTFNITAIPNSNTSYFYDYDRDLQQPKEYSESIEFTYFKAYLDDGFVIERKELLNLDGHIHIDINPTHSPSDEITYSYNGGDGTFEITTPEHPTITNLTINYNGKQKTYPLCYTVVDTIPPVIELSKTYIYASRNKAVDYMQYVSAYDPNPARDENNNLIKSTSGEALPSPIVISSDYNESEIGTYTVKFQITDNAGNSSEVKILTIEVQERVLDEIIITSNTEEYICDQDITLVVQPDSDIPINQYKDFMYDWYLDGQKFLSTTGDTVTGRSTTTLQIKDAGEHEIKVVLKAKFKSDSSEEIQTTTKFLLTTSVNLNNNKATILAAVVAIIIIITIMALISIIKYRKGKNSTSKKSSKNSKSKDNKQNNNGIQVIKNYNGTSQYNGSTDSGNGGGSSHLPSNNDDNTLTK